MSRTTERPRNTYDPFNSLLLLAVASPPTVQVRNDDGSYAGGNGATDGFNEPNPVYDIEVPEVVNTRYRAISSVFADYEIIPGLNARINLGMDFLTQNIRTWSPAIPSTGGRPIAVTGSSEQTNFNPSYLAEYTLSYKRSFGNHNFNALGGYTVQDNNFNYLGASRAGYTRLDLRTLDDAATVPTNLSQIGNFGGYGTNRLLSYVGRVGYDFKEKYIVSFSLRRDGSSNFGPGNKYAVFPSVSVAWNVMDEAFMAQVPLISNLKVRASIGQTGNQNVAAFAYLQRINTAIQYPFGDNSSTGGANAGAAPTSTKNPILQWEKNQQTNLGIDLGILKNRINLSVDILVIIRCWYWITGTNAFFKGNITFCCQASLNSTPLTFVRKSIWLGFWPRCITRCFVKSVFCNNTIVSLLTLCFLSTSINLSRFLLSGRNQISISAVVCS
jgi:hypothetical protein